MTASRRGDVVPVGFVFSDESGKKLRPALAISSTAYNRGRKEVVVAAITSKVMLNRKLGVMAKVDTDAVDSGLRRSLAL
jgi:mRNA-degrading endonuclease toxin of MazEF toxin-antitoxin module